MPDTVNPITPPATKPAAPAAKPAPAAPAPKEPPKPKYLVIALSSHAEAANEALAQAAKDGYTKLEHVYVVTTPSSASSAFAVLSA